MRSILCDLVGVLGFGLWEFVDSQSWNEWDFWDSWDSWDESLAVATDLCNFAFRIPHSDFRLRSSPLASAPFF